ncbi:ABC transporter permease [Kordiimonas sp. SCSIO 12610]|uniref:ABC transporter permease n=1 Tax=Kordiimonas sp. SCSIO 12610 TaxID=2829597 RepID=UPI00210D3EB6|nr:ABC transporter permease [Kordiimonas sp. SCSIO 12610]UTW53901.1 ABC transporter permease [Kordiimonas sp. SCSIO 12610]
MLKRTILPISVLCLALIFWEYWVSHNNISKFILPAPSLIWDALIQDFSSLMGSLFATVKVTLIALVLAVISGVLLAFGFSVSKSFESAFYPFAVILQVTPIVSIAPLVLIWVGIDGVDKALVIIAWLAAFFPILSNMSAGLKSVDPHLDDLFRIYKATKIQKFLHLSWPTALPYLLASLRISGGLSLIGAVVAEFVAGSGGSTGLAWRILEAGNRLQVEKMFAGLILLALLGIVIFYSFVLLEWIVLRKWHPAYQKK